MKIGGKNMEKIALLKERGDERVVDVLNYLRAHPKKRVKICDWQKEFGLGFARAARIFDLLDEAGIISDRKKYKMVAGEDGKRHREYIPVRLAVSVAELEECIEALEKK